MDNLFLLRERTVIVAGPVTNTVQNLIMQLVQNGADVAIVNESANQYQKFADQMMDQREVNEKFGRCAVFETKIIDLKSAQDVVGKVAHTLGGVDALVDVNMYNAPTAFDDSKLNQIGELLNKHLSVSVFLCYSVLPFFKNRKRGRILFVMNEADLGAQAGNEMNCLLRSGLQAFCKSLSKTLVEFNVTCNTLTLALSEEYILSQNTEAKATIKELIAKMKQTQPHLRLTDPIKVAESILSLLSPMGVSITGQNIELR